MICANASRRGGRSGDKVAIIRNFVYVRLVTSHINISEVFESVAFCPMLCGPRKEEEGHQHDSVGVSRTAFQAVNYSRPDTDIYRREVVHLLTWNQKRKRPSLSPVRGVR
jgi:hypothetical protein